MKYLCFLCVAFLLLVLPACTSEPPAAGATDSVNTAAYNAVDPLSGTWTGDWGTASDKRNPVTLALTWDGTKLNGTVNSGTDDAAITQGSFSPDTGVVLMEASTPASEKSVRFMIEGKLADGAMTGTWTQDAEKGDFKITKS